MHDKNGVQIEAGNTLFNPYDRDKYHTVLQDADGRLYLGDFDSPLERYAPQIWWEVVAEEIFPGTRAALMSLGHNVQIESTPLAAVGSNAGLGGW